MPTPLSYPLLRQPLLDANGLLARPWQQFFQAFFVRVGGDQAMTNLELENTGALREAFAPSDVAQVAQLAATLGGANVLAAFGAVPPASLGAMLDSVFTVPVPAPKAPDIERLFDSHMRPLSPGPDIERLFDDRGTQMRLPGIAQTYTITNVVTDRGYDADATTLAELADVLGTLINDLRARGLVA